MAWKDDQDWERKWHGNCANSYWEETKQMVYAKKMGLVSDMVAGKYPVYDLKGVRVLDIGGGAYSMLLKTVNVELAAVVDPCFYPSWTLDRYAACDVAVYQIPGEKIISSKELPKIWDEVWIYNCLQHTISPETIIQNARLVSKVIRLFEWIDMGVSEGHPHSLTEDNLNKWLGGQGKTENLNESGCRGRAYYGIFKGALYE